MVETKWLSFYRISSLIIVNDSKFFYQRQEAQINEGKKMLKDTETQWYVKHFWGQVKRVRKAYKAIGQVKPRGP